MICITLFIGYLRQREHGAEVGVHHLGGFLRRKLQRAALPYVSPDVVDEDVQRPAKQRVRLSYAKPRATKARTTS